MPGAGQRPGAHPARAARARDRAWTCPPLLAEARPAALADVVADIRAIVRDGATVFDEGVIKPGVSAELDQYRALAGDARQWIAALEIRERERTGVRGARVGYNKVFGYYLEVSLAQCAQPTDYYQRQSSGADTVGEHLERLGWIRKQTLANAERFVTPELKEMEARVARAHDDALQLERELYNALLDRLAERCAELTSTPRARWPLLDLFACAGRDARAPTATRVRWSTNPTRSRSSTAAIRWSSTACRRASSSPNDTRLGSRRASDAAHRTEHGRQEHLPAPGGADRAAGPDRQLRAGAHRRTSALSIASSRASAPTTTSPPAAARSWSR